MKAFEFTAVVLKGETSRTPLTSVTRFPEYYTYNNEQSVKKRTNPVERFIEFLEANREHITNNKIFGLE